MKQAGLVGCDNQRARFDKIMTEFLVALPVVIVQVMGEAELWAEWDRSQKAGHTELQHSTDRVSVRFRFFAKLKLSLQKILKDNGHPTDSVTHKELFAAYQEAEKAKKFQTAKGMTGVKRENELSQLMKWGEWITKIGEMDHWKTLEILTEGKTSFFKPDFGNSFCGLVENDEGIAKYVLNVLPALIENDEKWRHRVMEASTTKLKGIVKTLVLEWKWAKYSLVDVCKCTPIMPAEKMTKDTAVIETLMHSRTDALEIMADTTGKKGNLHPLFLELLGTCHRVLWKQEHFNTFQSAEQLNKNFTHTVQTEALQNLCLSNIMDPWKDAHAQFLGHAKTNGDDHGGHAKTNEEAENKGEMAHIQLPKRKEAIVAAAKNELSLYMGTCEKWQYRTGS